MSKRWHRRNSRRSPSWPVTAAYAAGAIALAVPIAVYLRRRHTEPAAPVKGTTGGAANAQSQARFGPLEFVPDPQPDNPEAIKITNGWDVANIVHVSIPEFGRTIAFHRKCVPHLQALFKAWNDAGLLGNILQYGGSWNPRFVRGSKTILSNHAFATALDFNMEWNCMGCDPAPAGTTGSMWELAQIAKQLGWRWGGEYSGRVDAMHLERLSCD